LLCNTLSVLLCVFVYSIRSYVTVPKGPAIVLLLSLLAPRWGVLQMRLLFLPAFVLQAALRVVVAAVVANKLLGQVAKWPTVADNCVAAIGREFALLSN